MCFRHFNGGLLDGVLQLALFSQGGVLCPCSLDETFWQQQSITHALCVCGFVKSTDKMENDSFGYRFSCFRAVSGGNNVGWESLL